MSRTPTPSHDRGRPGRRPCPGPGQRPLPDPSDLRLCTVPDTAPPYDDEALAGPEAPGWAGTPRGAAGRAGGPSPGRPEGQDPAGDRAGDRAGADGGARPAVPGQFAQVLIETLAGTRPPRQLASWTTQRARGRIQRLGPVLSAGPRPRLRRVVTFQPRPDVIEMTLVLSCGPRVRALAVRLEQLTPRHATIGQRARPARWCCTEVEAA
jgi:Family of unknown function (DUF6459)